MELINPRVRSMVRASLDDPEAFWAAAAELLPWFQKWDSVLDWNPERPDERGRYFTWFQGARTNLAYNCIDRHVERGWGGHAALVYENERGERRVLTYAQLMHEVKRVAAALRALGIGRGDRVGVYMPTCPEAIAVMLACARIGAIHLVVFAGFGSGALGGRLAAAECKALFCTDLTYRKGKDVPLLGIVDEALAAAPSVEKVVVLRRAGGSEAGRLDWEEFLALGQGDDSYEELESNEPAYILATSGTAGVTRRRARE